MGSKTNVMRTSKGEGTKKTKKNDRCHTATPPEGNAAGKTRTEQKDLN